MRPFGPAIRSCRQWYACAPPTADWLTVWALVVSEQYYCTTALLLSDVQ